MMVYVCDECGEQNPSGTTFCTQCHAFLAWDDVGRPTTAPPTTSTPRTTTSAAPPRDTSEGKFRIAAKQDLLVVAANGAPSSLDVTVSNTSNIVEGYAIEAPAAPRWLQLQPAQVELLPGTDGTLVAQLKVLTDGGLVPAQQVPITLRVRSLGRTGAYQDLPVVVTVPAVDVAFQLRAEPSLLRLRDSDRARVRLTVDNSGANRGVRLRFSGTDPESVVRFGFAPEVVDVGPGQTADVEMTVLVAGPEPGSSVSRILTVRATALGSRTDAQRVDSVITLQQSTSIRTPDPPVGLEVEPGVVRVQDNTRAAVRLLVDNRNGKGESRVTLTASDPERVVAVSWSTPQVWVPTGGVGYADAQLDAPLPAPGGEVSRTITIRAVDGARTSTASVTFVQGASASPMTTLGVFLEPSVLRLMNRRRGRTSVSIDNRQGALPVRVWLRGADAEGSLSFTFGPEVVDVMPGNVGVSTVTIDGPRPASGKELSRPFAVLASDGQAEVHGEGTFVSSASDRRPVARVLLTLFGAVAMIASAFLPWLPNYASTGFDLNADLAAQLMKKVFRFPQFAPFLSVGTGIIALGVVALFGLTGATGKLTRRAALLGIVGTAAVFVTTLLTGNDTTPGSAVVLVVPGCVLAFIGGMLVRR